jgi:hypothetical protein
MFKRNGRVERDSESQFSHAGAGQAWRVVQKLTVVGWELPTELVNVIATD